MSLLELDGSKRDFQRGKTIINLLISQVNLMLCYVNDLYDLKTLSRGVYKQFKEHFDLRIAVNFVMDMFKQTAE